MDPYAGTGTTTTPDAQVNLVARLSEPLYAARGWMKLAGVLSVVYGVLTALTLIGLLVAWIPIWMGVLLFQAAKAVEQAYRAADEQAFLDTQAKLKTYFIITGVLALVLLAVTILQFLGMGVGMLMHGGIMEQMISPGQ